MRLDFIEDTRPKKTEEFDTKILASYRVYTDNGPSYPQEVRYMRHQDIDRFDNVVRCARCDQLMTGGYTGLGDKKRYCNSCHKELLLREIVGYFEEAPPDESQKNSR